MASIKISELLDSLTLKIDLEREEFEKAAAPLFSRVKAPVEEALRKVEMTINDIH